MNAESYNNIYGDLFCKQHAQDGMMDVLHLLRMEKRENARGCVRSVLNVLHVRI